MEKTIEKKMEYVKEEYFMIRLGYFYYVEFSDSSREYSASFNKNNPNSYNLIYRYAAEPYRTSLLDKMNELNLNK
ncbi:MAG: hypothetical protein IPJ43_05635 [Saprospiraceae bacterium]|nr:hypothetical protein [Saprospiraceae bacterium]